MSAESPSGLSSQKPRARVLDYGLDPATLLNRLAYTTRPVPLTALMTYNWRWGMLQWLGGRFIGQTTVFASVPELQILSWGSLPERLKNEHANSAQQLKELGGNAIHAVLTPYANLHTPLVVTLIAQAHDRLLHSYSVLNPQGSWSAVPVEFTVTTRQEQQLHEFSTVQTGYLSKCSGGWSFKHSLWPRASLAELLDYSKQQEPAAQPLSPPEWQTIQRQRHADYLKQLMAWKALTVSGPFTLAEVDAQPEAFFGNR